MSGVCDVASNAGTSSLWSLWSHWCTNLPGVPIPACSCCYDSVCPVPRALDYSNQDSWMVVRVEVDVMVGVNFLSKHSSTNWGVISLSLVHSNGNPSIHPLFDCELNGGMLVVAHHVPGQQRQHPYIRVEFGSETDCFQGLGLKCIQVQVSCDWEQWGSIAGSQCIKS